MLPQFTSTDFGNPVEPGEYGLNGMLVSVDANHIAVWREQPSTVFGSILLTRVNDRRVRLALGAPLKAE